MTIDPNLYKKYTGRTPGDAMSRYANSLARESGREREDTSILGALGRGHRWVRLGGALLVLGLILYFLLTMRNGV